MRGEERRRGGREEKRIERRIAATFVDRHTHTNYEACSAMSTHQLIYFLDFLGLSGRGFASYRHASTGTWAPPRHGGPEKNHEIACYHC